MIEHSGVVNLVRWHVIEYEVSELSKATAMAGVGFDAFGWEVWPYYLERSTVYIVNNETRISLKELLHLLIEEILHIVSYRNRFNK